MSNATWKHAAPCASLRGLPLQTGQLVQGLSVQVFPLADRGPAQALLQGEIAQVLEDEDPACGIDPVDPGHGQAVALEQGAHFEEGHPLRIEGLGIEGRDGRLVAVAEPEVAAGRRVAEERSDLGVLRPPSLLLDQVLAQETHGLGIGAAVAALGGGRRRRGGGHRVGPRSQGW